MDDPPWNRLTLVNFARRGKPVNPDSAFLESVEEKELTLVIEAYKLISKKV